MSDVDAARAKAEATYNAASDQYDDAANSFWSRFGERTIERVGLKPGDHVLDVCCGSGASAIPAAERVGPSGSVLGIDLAERLLERARAKAAALGLKHAEFRAGDMLELLVPKEEFDAVVCVFGIFFVPDMAAAVRSLWSVVQPGGVLAVTTWGPRFFEPASTAFWRSIEELRPDLRKKFNPWDRIVDPPALQAVLRAGGVEQVEIVAERGEHRIATPEDWWSAVMGSGYRGTIEQLTWAEREHVRATNLRYIEENGVHAVEANVVYATARKDE